MHIEKQIYFILDLPPITFCHNLICISKCVDNGVQVYKNYKLSILLADGLAAVCGDKVYTASSGDVLLFRPDEIHFGRFLRTGTHEYMDFLIPEDVFTALGSSGEAIFKCLSDKNHENHLIMRDENNRRIMKLAARCADLAQSDDMAVDILLFAYLVEILDVCRSAANTQSYNYNQVPAVVSNALRYMNAKFAEIRNLMDIASKVNCSVTYLTRSFRKYTGSTVYHYLTERRICHAKILLSEGTSLTNACYMSGFGDCSNFIKIFKKHEGMTPHAFQTIHNNIKAIPHE